MHNNKYPTIKTMIQLNKAIDPKKISDTMILIPMLNLPTFRTQTPFVCPIDNVNPNRVFPNDPTKSYSKQMTHTCINEFIIHTNTYINLHNNDIPKTLVPFVIYRTGNNEVAKKSKAITITFGLPYVLTVSKPVQP